MQPGRGRGCWASHGGEPRTLKNIRDFRGGALMTTFTRRDLGRVALGAGALVALLAAAMLLRKKQNSMLSLLTAAHKKLKLSKLFVKSLALA